MNTLKKYGFLFIIAGFTACQSNPQIMDEEVASPDLSKITLTKDKIERSGIVLGKIEKQLLSDDVHARGKVKVLPQNRASVVAFMGGVIKQIKVNAGQMVQKGQLLATYASPELINIQEDYIRAKSGLDYISKNYERQKNLMDKQINSEKEFQNIEAEFISAKGNFSACQAKIELLNLNSEMLDRGEISQKIAILSPINGLVSNVNVNIGKYAEEQEVLFEIINNTKVVLEIMVFEKDIHLVKEGQRVTFSPTTQTSLQFEAKVTALGAMVEPDARVIKVVAEIEKVDKNLVPGLFVSTEIHTSEQYLDALPEEAVIIESELDKYGFYTTDDPNAEETTFHRFDLITGYAEDGYVHVQPKSTLPENARIVLSGIYYIKSEIMSNAE